GASSLALAPAVAGALRRALLRLRGSVRTSFAGLRVAGREIAATRRRRAFGLGRILLAEDPCLLPDLPQVRGDEVHDHPGGDRQGDQAEEGGEDPAHHLRLLVLGARRRPRRHLALLVVPASHDGDNEQVVRPRPANASLAGVARTLCQVDPPRLHVSWVLLKGESQLRALRDVLRLGDESP